MVFLKVYSRLDIINPGCAIAILAGYTCERKLAGVAGLSGWLPLHKKFASVYPGYVETEYR